MEPTDISKVLKILPSSLHVSIKNIIKDEDYVKYNVKLNRIDTGGGNYLGELFEIDVKGETTEGAKETSIFIKKKVILNKIEISVDEVYLKEDFFYNDLSQVFKYLQDQANVPLQERYRIAKAYDVTNSDAIILENLAKRNFKTYNRRDVIPLKYAELAIKELSKLHALSFVLENKMPKYFNEKIKTLNYGIVFNEDWREFVKNNCRYVVNMYEDNEIIQQKIENYLPIILDKYPKYYDSSKTTAKCTLSHNDYRINNVLVREKDGIPVEVIPVDYQTMDYGCPIRDFLYFIFTGSDREFRRKNLNNLKELYFESLSEFLKYFDMNAEEMYPRSEFEKVYSEYLDFGLMLTIYLITFLHAPEAGYDLENMNLSDVPIELDDHSQRLLREVIEDFIEWGYL